MIVDVRIGAPAGAQTEWMLEFHRGRRETFHALYRDYFGVVERAVGSVLTGADKETVIHEVFYQVMANADVRRGFRGGSFVAWLTTLSRNRAIDFLRRRQLEQPMGADADEFGVPAVSLSFEPYAQARLAVERFRATVLPAKWQKVFEARFILQLEQHEAARELGMSRTTLAYQEYRIRKLLHRFIVDGAPRAHGS